MPANILESRSLKVRFFARWKCAPSWTSSSCLCAINPKMAEMNKINVKFKIFVELASQDVALRTTIIWKTDVSSGRLFLKYKGESFSWILHMSFGHLNRQKYLLALKRPKFQFPSSQKPPSLTLELPYLTSLIEIGFIFFLNWKTNSKDYSDTSKKISFWTRDCAADFQSIDLLFWRKKTYLSQII